MAYIPKTYEEILQDSVDRLTSFTPITQLTPGAKAKTLLEATSNELDIAYTSFDINLAEKFVRTASGQNLDFIGEIVGTPRLPAQNATVNQAEQNVKFYVLSGTFGDINEGNDISVSRGTVVSAKTSVAGTEQSIDYVVTEDFIFPSASTERYISVSSIESGSQNVVGANAINSHDFTNYTGYQDDSLKVLNLSPIFGATDEESDANYRYRVSRAVTAYEAANETAIRLSALSIAGVSDIVSIPYDRGAGSFALYIKSVYPVISSALIDQVQQAINRTQAYGNKGLARSPKNTGISMTITLSYREELTLSEKDAIHGQVEDAIIFYLNNLDIGEDFIVDELIQRVLDTDERIKMVGTSSKKFDELVVYKDSRLFDNRAKQSLIGNYISQQDERIIAEYTIASPVVVRSA